MFCRNCGKELDDSAVACMGCGCDPRKGNKHCHHCGVEVQSNQVVCVKCGTALSAQEASLSHQGGTAKDKTTFLVLGILLGALGIHNFYAGYTVKGVIQLCLSIVSCGILAPVSSVWAIVEALTVETDASGVPFRK